MMRKNILLSAFKYFFTSCCYGNFGDIMAIKSKVEIDRYALKGKKPRFFKNQNKKTYMTDDVQHK